jgi:hypothetical protein
MSQPSATIPPAIVKEKVRARLFTGAGVRVYALVDGASAAGLREQLAGHPLEHCCLFSGELHPSVAETAPYLVRVEVESELLGYLFGLWNQHAVVFATVAEDLEFRALRKHFRSFLMVRAPDGKTLYFRYYDPRVLRVYLPTCNVEEQPPVHGRPRIVSQRLRGRYPVEPEQ